MNAHRDPRSAIASALAAGFATHVIALKRGSAFEKAGADGLLYRCNVSARGETGNWRKNTRLCSSASRTARSARCSTGPEPLGAIRKAAAPARNGRSAQSTTTSLICITGVRSV
jgi:hypothetical protein